MERVAMAAKAANVITIERTTTLLHRASRPNEHDVPDANQVGGH
jgi:hypothetical protein